MLSFRLFVIVVLCFLVSGFQPASSQETESSFFSTVWVDDAVSVATGSDGDLWPSAWGPDGALYAANGDGAGFSPISSESDVVVSRITGNRDNLRGISLAAGKQLGAIWSGDRYNRKPTGMVSVHGVLYLAMQDLNRFDFDDAPAASILRSDDLGKTWRWDRSAPMFKDHVFTTIMFLDFGKNSGNAMDGYVYAYGLDNNWRDAHSDKVPDPTNLYLARVPSRSVDKRAEWEFFTGAGLDGVPRWSRLMGERKPVLHTERRIYPQTHVTTNMRNQTVLSQGGVVYNKPLKRYIYSSWTEYTFEFFESPTPWGPWKLFYQKDFGMYPWNPIKHGGYSTTIPSKFISADGRTMYVQDNTFNSGIKNYRFALRRMRVEPRKPSQARNAPDPRANLARQEGTVPVAKTFSAGHAGRLNDGQIGASVDDWDKEDKPASWWGYTWPRLYTVDTVVFTSGAMRDEGGWFREPPRVQVRQDGRWVDVKGQRVSPEYSAGWLDKPFQSYVFRFESAAADGVRLIGAPGGTQTFTSAAELAVYHTGR